MIVEQGPIALIVGEGGDCLDIFFLISHLLFLTSFSLLYLGDDPIAILSQRAIKPQTANQLKSLTFQCVNSRFIPPLRFARGQLQ